MSASSQPGVQPDRIDLEDPRSRERWMREFDASEAQLREAVRAVGAKAADVELHLKGARSSSNAERVRELGG